MYNKVEEAIHFMVKANKGQKRKNENIENSNNQSKTLVVYFSAQNHTKAVAEKITDKLTH